MKVLLIRSRELGFPSETNIIGIYPPLGLAYLASVLKKQHYRIKYLDEQILGPDRSVLRNEIIRFSPDVVLLSSTTLLWPAVLKLSRFIKAISRGIIVGVGGPHLTVYPQEALSFESIDFGVYGEGEDTVSEILKSIGNSQGFNGIKGCIFRSNNKVVINPAREGIKDLDSIPFPAIDVLPYRKYFAFSVRHPFFPMITSRGCPYTCKFCFQGYLGRYRIRSAENVVEEMEVLVNKYNVQEIIVFDETFAIEKERVERICELINKKQLKFKWDIRTRINLLNQDILKSLKMAGCSRIHLGIESGNQEILDKMGKGIVISEIVEKVNLAKKFGFELRGYFMLAYPGETYRSICNTIEFAKSLPLDWASFTITIGLPETIIYKEALEKEYFRIDYWREYIKGNILDSRPYFIPEGLEENDLLALKKRAYLEFYLRPKIIRNILKNLNLNDWAKNFPVFLNLLPSVYHSIAKI